MNYKAQDVINDVNDTRIRGALNQRCCFDNNEGTLIYNLNNDIEVHEGILCGMDDCPLPFVYRDANGNTCRASCFVVKKQTQIVEKIVPYDFNKKEDRDELRGKWIYSDEYEMLISCFDHFDDDHWEISGMIGDGQDLYDMFKDAEGNPVGRLVEEEVTV